MRDGNHGAQRFRFLALREREDGMLADFVAGVFSDDSANDLKSTPAARISQPENGLTPKLFGLIWRREFLESLVGRRVGVQRDRRHRGIG